MLLGTEYYLDNSFQATRRIVLNTDTDTLVTDAMRNHIPVQLVKDLQCSHLEF